MSDPMKNFKFCVSGRRKESITKETIANLPKVNLQDMIDRIYVKPYVLEDSCPDPSMELIRPSKLKESRTTSNPVSSKLEPLPVLRAAQMKNSLDLTYVTSQSKKKLLVSHLPPITQMDTQVSGYGKLEKDYGRSWFNAGAEELYGMTNIHEIIKIIRMNPQLDFVYLTPVAKKNSVNYHYYNLKLVPYKEIDKTDYCTVSQRGVMRVRISEDNTFISLDRFDEEFSFFVKLIKIRLFKLFRQWKAFSMWRKNVKFEKFQIAQVYLKQYLFYTDDYLRPSLLSSRELCLKMEESSMCKFKKDNLYTLEAFIKEQMQQLKMASDRLQLYREQIKLTVMAGCKKVFASVNYKLSDQLGLEKSKMTVRMTHLARTINESLMANKDMSYTEQAQKRGVCRRLASFIKLVDYLMASTLHSMVVGSVQEVLLQLIRHIKKMPKELEILEWMKTVEEASTSPPNPDRIKKMIDEKKGAKIKLDKTYTMMHMDEANLPLFSIEFQLKDDEMVLEPDEEIYQLTMHSLTNTFQETVLEIPNLTTDQFFYVFMKHHIGKYEQAIRGPDLPSMFRGDKYLKVLTDNIIVNISKGFQAVYIYQQTFMQFIQFYVDNKNFNMEAAKNENHDVPFFANGLEKYHMQCRMIDVIQARKSLGLFLVDAYLLKNGLLPSPLTCLDVFNTLLPWKARKEAERLTTELQDAKFTLEFASSTTQDYVNQLLFLDRIQERIDELVKEAEVVKEMYELLDKFAVPTPPEDFAVYATLVPSINVLYNCIDKVLGDHDKNRTLFNASLEKDISEFNKELKVLKQLCQNQAILDPNTSVTMAYEILENLLSKMKELQERAALFKSYQKALKVPVTTYEELGDVNEEIKMKQLLWDSIVQWDKNIQEWMDVKLDTLDPEDLTNTTMKFVKTANQLEKSLPPNGLVPKLRERIEKMKVKLPMITDLRNPTLKPRHWEVIEDIVEFAFTPDEPMTLGRLEQIKAFKYWEKIQEISAQASSEASLESILKKVEDSWKTLEFVVIPYKDQKDVYILGGVDDIQMVLDDSNVNISTIASSHHCKPIKGKVDEWAKQLDIFGKTLDAWLACQRSWIYFESIFSAPDIQRQLPSESKLFTTVDKSFKDIMRKVYKVPLAIRAATQPGLLETLQNNNVLLEQIQKCLDAYLESKRAVFPRFYFLSNDEMLEILAQTRNPQAVQPHLRKCFDAIHRLEFAGVNIDNMENLSATNEILSMISPEGERVAFGKGLKARGNVEEWLGKVEEVMVMTIKKLISVAIGTYAVPGKENWITSNASQVVLTVSQMMWCRDVTEVLERKGDRIGPMKELEMKSIHNLNKLAALVRGKLAPLDRATICTLITIDVHARDIVSELVKSRVTKADMFEWKKQLRYYWEKEDENMLVKMSNSTSVYGCEYLGNSPRLVITPLTDRCYLCLMGALQLDLGGAPAGPAGTGKTETTKDLAKAIAKQCVVFNCSEGLDYLMMGRFFSGLAQSGAWCCFDEFNRIDIEVLSVIAQQLLTIRNAKAAKVTRFMFEGREIKLVSTCAAFITMNPGYAGRTELPDNLKALFRPMAMMVPDYCMIAEVILYSEGFESSKSLAQKMSQMYKLSSEQLSQQDHYDFGMRALKSVLVMAGSLKRQNPDKNEDVVLIRALRDSNLPKFLKSDAILFEAILQDLFPGLDIPEHNYGYLEQEIQNVASNRGLQCVLSQEKKVIQLYETMLVRHGVMLVGPTGAGKTTVYNILADVCVSLHNAEIGDPFFRPVRLYVLNPKSITMGELFGQLDNITLEWMDGLMAVTVRQAVQDPTDDHQWIICDGPVDALWVENLNTVLDDNKMLCLANSERIKFTPHIHMLFEVQDLAVASPATVSRCGMVYVDQSELRWMPYVESWMESKCLSVLPEEVYEYLHGLFVSYVEDGLEFVRKYCSQTIQQVDISKVQMICKLLESLLLSGAKEIDFKLELTKVLSLVCMTFVFCYLWGLGGNISESNWDAFDSFIRNQFEEDANAKLPVSGDLWGQRIDFGVKRMESWEKVVTLFKYSRDIPFFEILVPTVDTVRYAYLLDKLLLVNQAVLFTGITGVGKSVIARGGLLGMYSQKKCNPVFLNFSAQTTSARFQEMIEGKMEKKRKNIFGSTTGMKLVIMVDDVNMPKPDRYGSQPPIELLRQIVDFGGFYDRQKLFWKELQDLTICAACAPPGGGRNPISPRLLRHFSILSLPSPSDHSLKTMFTAILGGFYLEFPVKIRQCIDPIVRSGIEIYSRMSASFLPTPTKSHYIFNLRDLSKCMQGMLQVDINMVRESKQIYRLFYHESLRVFHDRLINQDDKLLFHQLLAEVSSRMFTECPITVEELVAHPILFGDFMKMGLPKEEKVYEEISMNPNIPNILRDYLDDYNIQSNKELKLVFFMDAIEHLTRIARVLRQQRGNSLLVGVGGCGKQSLTKLAAHICECKCFQIDIRRGYDYAAYHDDLKQIYHIAGIQNQPTVFLLTDTQIIKEEFLEDLNNILNSGEVPNLFEPDEYEKNLAFCRPAAKEAGIPENNRDGIYQFFINRVRNNLHIALCMSPVGTSFRSRCRMFPSLVNCCTIDWFVEWPSDALYTVSREAFDSIELGDDSLKQKISSMCVEIHTSVGEMAHLFYEELRRKYYTTPTSYLELINLYISMLGEKKKQITSARDRVKNGLAKLLEANDSVDKMKVELIALEPELKEKSEKAEKLMEKLAIDQEAADEVRKIVKEEEMIAEAKAKETQAIADDAMRDLNEALPALENSIKALDALDKGDISEIRVYAIPPELVQTVMEAVCLLLNVKTDWASAKVLLGDPNFLRRLKEFDKEHIPDALIKKLKKYIDNPKFTPDAVEKVSRASRSLCMWVRAIDLYAHVFRTVEPKRRKHAEAQAELDLVKENLKQKQEKLNRVEDDIRKMQKLYDDSVEEKMFLTKSIALTQARLRRAGKLTTALMSEKSRWEESIKMYDVQIGNVIGDVFISAACIAYFGAFTSTYRNALMNSWTARCLELQIPVTSSLTLVSVLADPYEVRQWNSGGLPRDKVSVENAVLVTRSRRWPLMIDPQEQANRWIRNKEAMNSLKVIKSTEQNLLRTFETAIRLGLPVLLEDVGEILDPSLDPILLRQTFLSGGRLVMHLGDSDVDYDKNFRFYMTTKLPNPHFMPEVCVKVTIINFTVTPSGLEEQLLGDVVGLERLDLEDQRNQLIVKINTDKNQLKSIEDKILKLLFESEGTILDNEDLINTLNDSKVTSGVIIERLKDAEATEEKISHSREKYRVVATRGSIMYFVVANMAEVDGMYQFSLKYFKSLFSNMVSTSPKNKDLGIRLQTLLNCSLEDVYRNVSRGLFEKDKLVFSFMLCVEIMKNDGLIPSEEWDYFCRGLRIQNWTPPAKSQSLKDVDDVFWIKFCELRKVLPFFDCLKREFRYKRFSVNLADYLLEVNFSRDDKSEEELVDNKSFAVEDISKSEVPADDESLNTMCSSFQKLLLTKIFKREQIMHAIVAFVKENLGKFFVESPPSDLATLYADMSNVIPLVFILCPGSDPMSSFQKFVKERNYQDRVQAISLGQGQGPVAKKLLHVSMRSGDWIFLQNCHLAASWMPELEDIIKLMINKPSDISDDFRLFLSSVPSSSFPIFILQNSVKVTNEPPKGIKSNLRRALNEISPFFYEEHSLGMIWKKLVFGICFFHSVILERKKFGPLGWNIKYDFNDSDRECALLNLQMFCTTSIIPWDALSYITSEITYGGRVTDQWDQRCLRTVLRKFFHQDAMLDGYKYSESGLYYAPTSGTLLDAKEYVENLPINDPPEIFGMHDNADLAFQHQEISSFMATILGLQPRILSTAVGMTSDEIIESMVMQFLRLIPEFINLEKHKTDLFQLDEKGRMNSLSTVFLQEVERYNKLLQLLRESLNQLQKAIKGFVVMSEDLEMIYNSFLDDKLPQQWSAASYQSMKPLSSWVADLVDRIEFLSKWATRGEPLAFWISGFYFPQGFLTGVLQRHARRFELPIDHLSFRYVVLSNEYNTSELNLERYSKMEDNLETMLPNIESSKSTIMESITFKNGIIIYGLFADGFRWSNLLNIMEDSLPGEMNSPMPYILMDPIMDYEPPSYLYQAPLYKTSERAGVLSTTGHSTNFVVTFYLPSTLPSRYWICKGSALLCQLNS